jgi:hypothetical protein
VRVLRGIVSAATVAALAALALAGCAQMAAQRAAGKATECLQVLRTTEEAKILRARIWQNDGTDTSDKLSDPKPLTKAERDALVRQHAQVLPCRQIIIDHDNQFAAWETPYWQAFFERSDAIYLRLASGEMAVGAANRLSIESLGRFQTEVSRGHAEAVQIEEMRRQRAAEAMLQASALILASQPRTTTTTTNCTWMGNNLNCLSSQR